LRRDGRERGGRARLPTGASCSATLAAFVTVLSASSWSCACCRSSPPWQLELRELRALDSPHHTPVEGEGGACVCDRTGTVATSLFWEHLLKPASPFPRHPHGVYGHYHRWHWHSLLLQHRSTPPLCVYVCVWGTSATATTSNSETVQEPEWVSNAIQTRGSSKRAGCACCEVMAWTVEVKWKSHVRIPPPGPHRLV
jgi:hypothetical protein